MSATLKNPIKSVPRDDSGAGNRQDYEVEVKPMTWEHVRTWHTVIQPYIDKNYAHAGNITSAKTARADVGWNWMTNYALHLLHSFISPIPGNGSGPSRAYAIVVKTSENYDFPIGMLTVVPEFHCTVNNFNTTRTFAWYLADAPKEIYTHHLQTEAAKGVAVALLDCAIQSGLDNGSNGELLLHADNNGGLRLQNFYAKCGMKPININNGPISILRRRNLSQYFLMDSVSAATFCNRLDQRR